MAARRRRRWPATLHPYAADVLEGRVVAGPLVRAACERALRDRRAPKKKGLRFDAEAAQVALDFFGLLSHSKGEWAGQPFELAPWEAFILWELFGWYKADGTRRYRVAYIEVARKNGKTSLLAGIGLYMEVADGEAGAEIYCAATKEDQARLLFEEAKRMVRASPVLSSRIDPRVKALVFEEAAATFKPLGADSTTLDGLNPHCNLIDELHAHPNGALYEVLDTATGARRNPMTIAITTAGDDETSFCYAMRESAERAATGEVENEELFAFIACLDPEDDWTDPAVWVKANPNLGVSLKESWLASKVAEATRSPRRQNAILRLNLNVWTRATTRFLDARAWDACRGDLMPHEIEEARLGDPCWAGLDLASTTDIAAFGVIFPPPEVNGTWDAVVRLWVPEARLAEAERLSRAPYEEWAREGWLTATDGDVIDYEQIADEILDFAQRHELQELGYDPWNATATVQRLQRELGAERVVKVPSSYGFVSAPTKLLERLVLAKELRHGGHPVLRWMASNLEVKEHEGAIRPVKPGHKMSHKKIDGMVALILALNRAMARGEAGEGASEAFSRRGLFST